MNTIQALAAQLDANMNEVNVPRRLSDAAAAEMLALGLICVIDADESRPDRRYAATEYAQDVIWGRLPGNDA